MIKYHLKRVLGNTSLNYEDFQTVLTQIEAILNSRPISPLSSSPDDYSPLTPAQFLVEKPLTAVPQPCYLETPENRLNQYKKLQQLIQTYWKRWNIEYITELQQRLKWQENCSSLIKPDDLVIVKEDGLPPLKWKTARIVETHPGSDHVIRVVTLKFSDGSTTKRPLTKICILPISDKLPDDVPEHWRKKMKHEK